MSASTPAGDSAMSPPASVTWNCRASLSKPPMNRSPQDCLNLRGKARDRNAAMGSPPMAAMSLSPRARQRWPTASGRCHSGRKCTPSREKSVVTSASWPRGSRITAQSSPIVVMIRKLGPLPARRRIFAIRAFSGSNKPKPIYRERSSVFSSQSSRPKLFMRLPLDGAILLGFAKKDRTASNYPAKGHRPNPAGNPYSCPVSITRPW
jgi:hypothetical protein